MRGRQKIWDSEGKNRREKGRNDNFCFYFVQDNSESQLPGSSKEETYIEDEDELLDFLYSHGELVSSYLVSSPNVSSQNWNVIYEDEVDVAPVVSSTPPTPKSHSETHGFKSMRPVLKRLTDEDLKKFGVGRKSSVSQLALTTSLTTADSHETKYYEFCTFGRGLRSCARLLALADNSRIHMFVHFRIFQYRNFGNLYEFCVSTIIKHC